MTTFFGYTRILFDIVEATKCIDAEGNVKIGDGYLIYLDGIDNGPICFIPTIQTKRRIAESIVYILSTCSSNHRQLLVAGLQLEYSNVLSNVKEV